MTHCSSKRCGPLISLCGCAQFIFRHNGHSAANSLMLYLSLPISVTQKNIPARPGLNKSPDVTTSAAAHIFVPAFQNNGNTKLCTYRLNSLQCQLSCTVKYFHCNIAVCSLGEKLGAVPCQRCYGRECSGGNFGVAGTYNKHACIRLTKSATQDILCHGHSVLAKWKLYSSAGRLTQVLQGSIKD